MAIEKVGKKGTENERERKIHIASTIEPSLFHPSLFPPSLLAFIRFFLSFFFFIYPRPFQRIISCAELSSSPASFPSPHRRPPIDIFKRKAGTMRGFECIIVASGEISIFPTNQISIIALSSGSGEKREGNKKKEKKNENRIDSYETTSRPLVNTRKRATELN